MDILKDIKKMIQKGEYEKALDEFKPLVEDEKTRLEVIGHRAWLYRSMARYEDALADYEVLVKGNPDDYNATGLKAETKFLLARFEEALQDAINLLKNDPRNILAGQIIRSCHQALGLEDVPKAPLPSHDKIEPIKPINAVIELLEKSPNSYPTSVYPEIGRFIYSFVRCYRPKLALETGSFIGYSSICIGQAMKENGAGHLHAFDLFMDRPEYESPVIGKSSDSLHTARSHVEKAGLSDIITFYKGDSSKTINEVFKNEEPRFDFAFIDGDHTIRGCLKDWQAVDNLLIEGGIVLLHDTMPKECGWLGPRYLLEELAKNSNSEYHWVNFPSPEGYGIGIIQKKCKEGTKQLKISLSNLIREYFFNKMA